MREAVLLAGSGHSRPTNEHLFLSSAFSNTTRVAVVFGMATMSKGAVSTCAAIASGGGAVSLYLTIRTPLPSVVLTMPTL